MRFGESFKIASSTCRYLKYSFIWPPKNEEMTPPRAFYIRLAAALLTTFVSIFIPLVFHLVKSLQKRLDISEDAAMIFSYIGLTSIMLTYALNHKKLAILIRQLGDCDAFGTPPRFDDLNKKLNFYSDVTFIYATAAAIFYNLAKLVEMPRCKEERDFEICGLIIPLSLPWRIQSWQFVVLLMFIGYCALTLTRVTIIVAVQILIISLNVKLRIDHLKVMLSECFQEDFSESRRRLGSCIRYHDQIVRCGANKERVGLDLCSRWSKMMNDCFSLGMFSHVIVVGLICGSLESQLMNHDVQAFGAILGWIVSLFFPCLAGQILLDSSQSLADAAYHTNWQQADVRLAKYVVLLMMRSQRPLVITAGPFNVLCFALFVSIMKFSYSVLTLLH